MSAQGQSRPIVDGQHRSCLQDDLKRAGNTPWGWVVNASLAGTAPSVLAARAAAE